MYKIKHYLDELFRVYKDEELILEGDIVACYLCVKAALGNPKYKVEHQIQDLYNLINIETNEVEFNGTPLQCMYYIKVLREAWGVVSDEEVI